MGRVNKYLTMAIYTKDSIKTDDLMDLEPINGKTTTFKQYIKEHLRMAWDTAKESGLKTKLNI